MREFVRPKVVVSGCLEFYHCRYNGDMISSPIVANLMEYVDFLPVCPEVELGLGIPRDPVRIVLENGEQRLVQSASGRNVTEVMETFCTDFLNSTGNIDGFILKYRSPSCGIKYERHLYSVFSRPSRYTSNINILVHAFGYFSEGISTQEKSLFFDPIQKYRDGKTSLCSAINTIRAWAVRFEDQYLMNQTFFDPFLEGLLEVDHVDSHHREDLWK